MMAWLWSEGGETLDDEMGGKQSSRYSGEATEFCSAAVKFELFVQPAALCRSRAWSGLWWRMRGPWHVSGC